MGEVGSLCQEEMVLTADAMASFHRSHQNRPKSQLPHGGLIIQNDESQIGYISASIWK